MVKLLINDISFPTILQDSINIDQTTSDPIPTFKFTLQDDPSHIALSEMLEVIFIDESAIANPTHQLLLNPSVSPYTLNWTAVTSASGGTISNLSPGVQFALSNASSINYIFQSTQPGLVIAGQSYMLSATVQTTTLSNTQGLMELSYYDAAMNILEILPVFIPTTLSATTFTISGPAPTGAAYIQVLIGAQPITGGANSGTVKYTNVQVEPMSFTAGNYQISYPTPFCANGQTNCTLMPDGTVIRQYRLFGGYITKATAGKYIGNNRQWTVTVSGYAWLLQKQLLNSTWTNQTDAYILGQIVSIYFPNCFNTSQIATGATLDNFGYTYNGTARDAADALAANANFFICVDAYRNLIYQPPGYNMLSFLLSDKPDNVTSFPYYAYTRDIDGTQLGNACLVTGATNISAVEYDAQSIGYYNVLLNGQGTFWRTVNDSSITTTAAARQRAIAENSTYNYARDIVHLSTWQVMIPGYTVLFSSATDGLYDVPLLIQKSTLVLLGFKGLNAPTFECQCDLGAYNPDATSITVKMLRKQQVSVNSIGTPVIGLMVTESLTFVDSVSASRIVYAPNTYGHGTYGSSTYFSTFPTVPSTTYGGTKKYGDSSVGYA